MHRETARIGDDTLTLETGRLAPKADGAVVLRHRETFILATVTAGEARPEADFLPLTVDYRERQAALGQIPGNYFRRETRADEAEILTSRMIDRAVRPLFAKGLRATVQIDVTVHAADPESDLAGLALTAAAAACQISGLPFRGPIAGLRIVQRDGALANAGSADTAPAELDVVIAVGRDGPVMLDGEASERPAHELIAAIEAAQMVLEPVMDAVDRLGEAAGKPPRPVETGEGRKDDEVRARLLAGERVDGRAPGELRPIDIELHPLSRAHGSALFCRGMTQALVSATLGTAREGVEAGGLFSSGRDRYIVHYNFPGFAAGEPRSVRGPGRRELGHGRLARRALTAVLPSEATWSGAARVVSDILSADGSSSMATVCGASLALLAAGVPITAPVAGVAMGLVRDGERAVVLTDLTEAEDHAGDIDLKIAGTAKGVTAIQLDTKPGVVPVALIGQALEQAEAALGQILDAMSAALDGLGRERPHPARHAIFTVAPGRVGQIIGSKGRALDALQGRTQTRIDVSRSGVITIVGDTPDAVAAARTEIEGSAVELRKDGIYRATVRTVRDYGALVRIGDHDGLVHVSEWGEGSHTELSEGDTLLVRVLGADRKGRIVLSRKAAAGAAEADALN